ncbi:MAG: hypothetical protein JSU00_24515 [Acidobacteria bacterium]|nr:hypothetical protein [Acidobacteriota bacterium]
MKRVVFYSWQSDLPNGTNRGFIYSALQKAVVEIARDPANEDVPIVDRDTEGVPGAPHIVKAIYDKIAAADVFVADVSIVLGRDRGRPSPNPNVLIEFGYALCRLGESKVILVFNDAYGSPDDLPFDLRIHRVIRYSMAEGAADKAPERAALQKRLSSSIKSCLAHGGSEAVSPPSQAEALLQDLLGPDAGFYLIETSSTTRVEDHYTFACAPHDRSVARDLTADVENQFYESISKGFEGPRPRLPPKRGAMTVYKRQVDFDPCQLFGLTCGGAIGMTGSPCIATGSEGLFFTSEFLYKLLCFLRSVGSYYGMLQYTRGSVFRFELRITLSTQVFERSSRGMLTPGPYLFDEVLNTLPADISIGRSMPIDDSSDESLGKVLTAVMHDIARRSGRVLSGGFSGEVRRLLAYPN